MPPHCDSLDGPVVTAARKALDMNDVTLVLPYVHEPGEDEVRRAFAKAQPLHRDGDGARDVADLYFFETVVRVHREGEHAPYTGLKPAGLDVGPAIPLAEKALETGAPDEVLRLLRDTVTREVTERLAHVVHLKGAATGGVGPARAYVGAMLGFEVWSNKVYQAIVGAAHAGEEHHAGD